MEVGLFFSEEERLWARSVLEAMVVETISAAGKSLALVLMATRPLLNEVDLLPKLDAIDGRFPFNQLCKLKNPVLENKDGDTEDDEEDDDEDENNQVDDDDDDAGDKDFSGEEGEEGGDAEDDPEANGEGGSDDEDEDDDDDDDDGDDDGDGDEDADNEDDEEEKDEEEELQPPAKRRK